MNFLLPLAALTLIGCYLYAPFLRRMGHQAVSPITGETAEMQAKAVSIQKSASPSAARQ